MSPAVTSGQMTPVLGAEEMLQRAKKDADTLEREELHQVCECINYAHTSRTYLSVYIQSTLTILSGAQPCSRNCMKEKKYPELTFKVSVCVLYLPLWG